MLKSAVGRTTLKGVGPNGSADGVHPNLGLHSAAASGNVGLVKFALENGQSANSSLNGILPLHAACSGGSEQAVRMLIYHGADVNAARLKSKAATGPGAEGSTPLHFAAANGHLEIARILLEAGARPAAIDKDGIQSEALALANSHQACAGLIRSWISAYGSNGLAGMVSSRDTVSGDVALGPAGYIRYAGAPASSSSAHNSSPSTVNAGSTSTSKSSASSIYNTFPAQKASDMLAVGTKQGSDRSISTSSKPRSIAKTNSNPNLSAQDLAVSTPVSAVPSSPTPSSTSSSRPILASSPVNSFSSLAKVELQPSPAHRANEDLATHVPLVEMPPPMTPLPPVQLRESKRRPSMPSIMEKAAHPAATIRAALSSGGVLTSHPLPNNGADPYQSGAASPSKKVTRLTGKRSLSNILRKATGSSTLSTTSSSASLNALASLHAGDAGTGSANTNAMTKSGRAPGISDHQRLSDIASNPTDRQIANSSLMDFSKAVTAPSYQTTFPVTPSQSPSSDALASARQFRLRSASSSSSTYSYQDEIQRVGRARSIPSDHVPSSTSKVNHVATSSALMRAKQADNGLGLLPVPTMATSPFSPTDAFETMYNDDNISRDQQFGLRTRSTSASSSVDTGAMAAYKPTSFFLPNRSNNDATGSVARIKSVAPDTEIGDGLDDRHHPGGLQNLETVRQNRSNSDPQTDRTASTDHLLQARSVRPNRNRSGSTFSAVSSGSTSGVEQGIRGSPTSSLTHEAELNGQTSYQDTLVSQSGQRVAENTGSRSSSSRTNNTSAAEQALAILSQESPFVLDGPGGTSTSLAAQLAAYGEALASERTGIGEGRTGPSPVLSTRGSNAALRSKLPSVSEDQTPSKHNPKLSASAHSGSLQEERLPNYPATAAQSYHRRVSRRPTSSEGNESQGSFRPALGQRGLSPGDNGSSSTAAADTSKHTGLRTLFLDAPRSVGVANGLTGLGSPLLTQSNAGWKLANEPEATRHTPETISPASLPQNQPADTNLEFSNSDEAERREPSSTSLAGDMAKLGVANLNRTVLRDNSTMPVLSAQSNTSFDEYPPSPRSPHHYSPSVPTELASYTTLRQERSLASPLITSSSVGLTTPILPPRKGSMHSPVPSPNASSLNVSGEAFLTPDAAHQNRQPVGRDSSLDGSDSQSSRWEYPQRPSLTMLRSATSSSSRSQSKLSHVGDDTQRLSTDEGRVQLANDASEADAPVAFGGGGGKRRLVRNLLGNIKGSS